MKNYIPRPVSIAKTMLSNLRALRKDRLLLSILLMSLILRFWGLSYGFPFHYPPDESVLVKESLVLPFRGFNPGHFDWPHLQYYLTFVVFSPIYLVQKFMGTAPQNLDGPLLAYFFAARAISVVTGTITILLTYLFAKRLFSREVGLLAALFLSLNSAHLAQSQLATLDITLTMWLMVFFLSLIPNLTKPALKTYAMSGFLLGLATSTKYNAGFAFIIILFIHAFNFASWKKPQTKSEVALFVKGLGGFFHNIKWVLVSAIMALVGFCIGTPFALIDFKTFVSSETPKGALWQFVHVGSNSYQGGIMEHYWGLLKTLIAEPLSWPLFILAILGGMRLFKSKSPAKYLVLPFSILYFLYVGQFQLTPIHYYLPLFPLLSILAALGLLIIIKSLNTFFKISSSKLKFASYLITLIIMAPLLITTIINRYVILQKDTRTQAYEWIGQNIPKDQGIVMGNDYEPDLTGSGYKLYSIYDFLLNEDLSRPIYPKFNDRNIHYGVLGDFDLAKRYDDSSWDPGKPNYPDYLLSEAKVVKRFDPKFRPGPTVMIFEIAYDYEVKRLHKNQDQANDK